MRSARILVPLLALAATLSAAHAEDRSRVEIVYSCEVRGAIDVCG